MCAIAKNSQHFLEPCQNQAPVYFYTELGKSSNALRATIEWGAL